MISLFKFLRAIHPLSEGLRDYLEDIVKEKRLVRKDLLLKAGQVCHNVYFVEKGLFRCYYTRNNKEVSSRFAKEGDICVATESFLTQKHSQESIQALEDSVVYYISFDELQRIYRDFEEFNKIGRVLVERCHLLSEQRMMAMWMQSADERLNWLAGSAPELVQRVPAKYLASYLGITEGRLSTIKGKR